MNELQLVPEIFFPIRKQQGKPRALAFQPACDASTAVGGAAQRSHHVVLHAWPGKYMRPQQKYLAASKPLSTGTDHLIRFFLVYRVSKCMGTQWMFLGHLQRKVGAVHRNATQVHQLRDMSAHPIGFSNRFQDTRCSSDIDTPHPLPIKDPGAQWIKDKSQMNDCTYSLFNEDGGHFTARD